MAKYVVDVPDEAVGFMDGEMSFFVEPKIKDERRRHYALRIDEEDISTYTESDRKDIEDKVWSLAREIAYDMSLYECEEAGMLCDDDIYESATGVLEKLSYQEARDKYEAWKKEKEEIHIGDEVQYSLAGYEYTFIVFGKENDTLYGMRTDKVDMDDICEIWEYCYKSDSTLVKTGRHFDEVSNLMERIRKNE